MKKFFAALALLLTSLLPISAALPAPSGDPTFDRLDQWATNLDNQGQNWDHQCSGSHLLTPTCQKRLEDLKAQCKQFIELAGQYHPNGSDFRAILHQRWIRFRIRSFTFNLKYAGVLDTSRQSQDSELAREKAELEREIKQCTGK